MYVYVCMYVKQIFSFLTIKRLNDNQPGHGSDEAHPALVLRTCTIPLRRVMRIDRLVQFYPFMVQVSNQIDALTAKIDHKHPEVDSLSESVQRATVTFSLCNRSITSI